MSAYQSWLDYLTSAEKSSIISCGNRKVFYKFPDGQQMVEEYSMDTGVVLRRAWRRCKQLMSEPDWEIEIGETIQRQIGGNGDGNAARPEDADYIVREANTAPTLTKRITKKNIEWRVRNLPYPIEAYNVRAEPERRAIVVRTTNKKYYKVIPVPELDRCGEKPQQANISIHHQYNTLIITYRKPEALCEMEAQVLLLLKNVPTETDADELLQNLLGRRSN